LSLITARIGGAMKFRIGALSLTIGLFWGGSILLVGVANL
jgi:hypothetical protein